jgi:hypothetical protein
LRKFNALDEQSIDTEYVQASNVVISRAGEFGLAGFAGLKDIVLTTFSLDKCFID